MPARVAHVRPEAGSRAVVERNHPRLVNHLVADGNEAGRLGGVVGIAVDRRHHRSGQAARDAAIVEAAIRVRIGALTNRAATACAGGSSPPPAAEALLRGRRLGRNQTVGWIAHHPGAAVLRAVVLVPVDRSGAGVASADAPGLLEPPGIARLRELRELGVIELFQLLPRQIARALERNAVLVLVAEAALN